MNLNVKCVGEDNICAFYNILRHISASYNILLRPLKVIEKETGVCQLTTYNCVGYKRARDIISMSLYLKLTGSNYFKNFPKDQTYVQAAANNSDGFKLLYRILEIIDPQLRISKGGIHKIIEVPSYIDVQDDSIFTLLNTKNISYMKNLTLRREHIIKENKRCSF